MQTEQNVQNRPCQIEQSEEHIHARCAETIQDHPSEKLTHDSADIASYYIIGRYGQAFASSRSDTGDETDEFNQNDSIDSPLCKG